MKKIKKYLLALLISMAFIPTVMAASKYTVKFNANGGKGTTSKVTCTVNKKCTLTGNKYTKAGYTFTGWNTKKDGSGKSYKNSAKVKNLSKKGTITLYAQWKANKYIIKFNGNGATSGSTKKMTATYDKKIKLIRNGFAKNGYTFTGWNTKKNGTGKLYKNESSVKNLVKSGTITLYAQWKKSKDKYSLGESFLFDGLKLKLDNTYTFDTIDNMFSDKNGSKVIKIGVSVKNVSEEKKSLNMFYYDMFGSKGTELDSVSFYFDDDIDLAGDLKPEASYKKYFYILYDGDGVYSIDFDNFYQKVSVEFNISYND